MSVTVYHYKLYYFLIHVAHSILTCQVVGATGIIFNFSENFTTYFTLLCPIPNKEFIGSYQTPLFIKATPFVPMTSTEGIVQCSSS